MGFYVQDDVSVKRGLTLNLGLRYEFATVMTEVHGKVANLRFLDDSGPTVGDPSLILNAEGRPSRVCRGGSYRADPGWSTTTFRNNLKPKNERGRFNRELRRPGVGFRVALSPLPRPTAPRPSWTVRLFAYGKETSPVEDEEAWRAKAEGGVTFTQSGLHLPFGERSPGRTEGMPQEVRSSGLPADYFGAIVSGPVFGSFTTKNDWVAKDGKVVGTDERVFTVYSLPDARLFDYTITIKASNGPVVFGDTKEGTMAMRLAPPLRVTGKAAKGQITTSGGHRDGAAWGKRNAWVDYSGPVEDKPVGVAIFDHPSNLRHPTWWHARQYGLFAANPFGIHDFERKPASTGDHTLKSGETLTFRYRFYIHAGDAEPARVNEMYASWAAE